MARRANSWEGVSFVPAAPADTAEHARQKEVAELFAAKATIPRERLERFQKAVGAGYRLIGWKVKVTRVVDSAEGATVELIVDPTIVRDNGSWAFGGFRAKETWKLVRGQTPSFEKLEEQPMALSGFGS